MPAFRSARPRAQPPQRQVDVVGHDEHVRQVDLIEPRQLADRAAAQVHIRERLDEQHVGVGPAPARLDRRSVQLRRPRQVMPSGQQVHHLEADVVSRPGVLAARIAKTRDQLHRPAPYFSSSSGFSTLPFLMTSGSAGAVGAATAAAAASAGAGSASTFGDTTWTMSMSASLTTFHLSLAARSRTRTPSWSIRLLMSTVTCSGMSAGRHSMTRSRCTKSTTPPSSLTPFDSPVRCTGTVTRSNLSIATR